MKVFTLRLEDSLAARVDVVRGDVPRSVWVRRAVERALDDSVEGGRATPGRSESVRSAPAPAPAEQPDPSVADRLLASSGGFSAKMAKEPGDEWAVSDRELVERYVKPLSRSEMFKRATQR